MRITGLLRAIASAHYRCAVLVRGTGRYVAYLAVMLGGGLGLVATAQADLAAGTPRLACTLPAQKVDCIGGTCAVLQLPSTGTESLKAINIYIDPPALVTRAGDPAARYIPPGTTPSKVIALTAPFTDLQCVWQTTLGEIPAGSRTARFTAVDQGNAEGPASSLLGPFAVPAPVHMGPAAPGSPTVQ